MQHREWNPKTFFKKVSSEVMAMYEQARELDLVRDPAHAPSDQVYFAWKALPEPQRQALETELLPVNDMCSSHARPYLDGFAAGAWSAAHSELIEASRDWSVYDLALRLYLHDPVGFARCHQAYAVDMMSHFQEYRGRYRIDPKASPLAKEALKTAMARHFRKQSGGVMCQVEDFEGTDKFALLIYHEGENTPFDRFNDHGVVVPDWQRPVVRIASVYYPESSTLLVKAPRKPEREKLRDLFAEIFARDPRYFEDATQSPKFNFDPLRDPAFRFPTHPADGIDRVSVTRLTVTPAHDQFDRMTVHLVPGLTLSEVHLAMQSRGCDLRTEEIKGVHLQFMFEGNGRSRFRTVSMFNPNNINLRDTHRDRVIRRYLREWEIDARRSAFAVAAAAVQAAAGQ